MVKRPRRNRQSEIIRSLVQENSLDVSDFIFPLFIKEGTGEKTEINSMPGIYRLTLDQCLKEIEECFNLRIKAFALFPVIQDNKKDKYAQESINHDGMYLTVIKEIKKQFPEVCIMTDVAMDPYSSDGHDGLVKDGEILNDPTLPILSAMAVAQVESGADMIAPSDMMDGRIGFIRNELNKAGFTNTSIISYSAKYASAFYGPFREALNSSPKIGDKKTYQMDPANAHEALIEAELDTEEGADILMVKPALPYLDVIQLLATNSRLPIAAYNVSGEYAMIKAAGEKGWLDPQNAMLESLLSIKRAGARIILSYFTKEFAIWKKYQS